MIGYLLPRYLRRWLHVSASLEEMDEAMDENVRFNLAAHERAVHALRVTAARSRDVNEQVRNTIQSVKDFIFNDDAHVIPGKAERIDK